MTQRRLFEVVGCEAEARPESAMALSAVAVTLERVAQDGVRVRASAGASSFRRKPTLEQCLVEAQAQVKSLREEVERDPAAATRREQAARERAAREREPRVRDAEKKRAKGVDPFAPLPGDSPSRAEWRQRMGTEAAQAIYKQRASTAECVNALARQRGLTQFRVRGLTKVKLIATWFALAHNVLRWAFFQNSARMTAGH